MEKVVGHHRRVRRHRTRHGTRLARDGAIAFCARRRRRLDEVAPQIVTAGGQALPIVADVTREDDMNACSSRRAVERFGRLDVMMCNAGFGIYGAIDDDDAGPDAPADGRQLRRHLPRRASRPRRSSGARRSGHLIVISSIVGKRGVPYMGAYSATKFAQVGLAECLRAELHGTGIHVSLVFPISTDDRILPGHDARVGPRDSRATARGSRSNRSRTPSRARSRRPVPEVFPYRKAARPGDPERARAGLLRSPRQEVGAASPC